MSATTTANGPSPASLRRPSAPPTAISMQNCLRSARWTASRRLASSSTKRILAIMCQLVEVVRSAGKFIDGGAPGGKPVGKAEAVKVIHVHVGAFVDEAIANMNGGERRCRPSRAASAHLRTPSRTAAPPRAPPARAQGPPVPGTRNRLRSSSAALIAARRRRAPPPRRRAVRCLRWRRRFSEIGVDRRIIVDHEYAVRFFIRLLVHGARAKPALSLTARAALLSRPGICARRLPVSPACTVWGES